MLSAFGTNIYELITSQHEKIDRHSYFLMCMTAVFSSVAQGDKCYSEHFHTGTKYRIAGFEVPSLKLIVSECEHPGMILLALQFSRDCA